MNFEFNWVGKDKLNLSTDTDKKLVQKINDGVDEDITNNIYIEGDNLEVLKILRKDYKNKIKCIYIDPPYNTGNKFIYKDRFRYAKKDLLDLGYDETEVKEIMRCNDKNDLSHSCWLNFMYPRLKVARDLLTDDGVIFISIDDNEVHNLRKICDEIFGEENYISNISVINNLKGRSDNKFFATCNEFLYVYAKEKNKLQIKGFELEEEKIDDEYALEDELGRYKLTQLRKTGKGWKREDRPFMFYPILFKDGVFSTINDDELSNIYSKETNSFNDNFIIHLRKKYENQGYLFILPLDDKNNYGRWRWGIKTFKESKNYELELNSQNKVCTKMRPTLEDGSIRLKSAKTLWYKSSYDTGTAGRTMKNIFNNMTLFDNPKSIYFLKDIFKLLENNMIILDFFSGSATTAHAVIQLNAEDNGNRKFIMVQLPEECNENTDAYEFLDSINKPKNICEIGKERIRRAGAKILEESKDKEGIENLDIGFKVFEVQ